MAAHRELHWIGRTLAVAFFVGVLFAVPSMVRAKSDDAGVSAAGTTDQVEAESSAWACWGKYPIGFFSRARSTRTVPVDDLLLCLKTQFIDTDEKLNVNGHYQDLPAGDRSRKIKATFVAKYGWAKNHHLALGVPYLYNDIHTATSRVRNDGFGNIYVFEKWNMIQEGRYVPAVSADVWYYFDTGNSDRKLGTSGDFWKATTSFSKAWPDFSVHLNPGYVFSDGRDTDQTLVDAAIVADFWKSFKPALEYNYTYKEGSGRSNDLTPGVIWKFSPGWCVKGAAVVNLDSTMPSRDEVGFVTKLSYSFGTRKKR